MTRLLHGLALAALLWSSPAWADPALWVARGPRATVYLFGSYHALPKGTVWQGPTIRRAFDSADRCVFELDDSVDLDAALVPLIQKYGIDLDQKLSDVLTPEELDKLDKAASTAGFSGLADFDGMRPWLVGLLLGVGSEIKKGKLDLDLGVDLILTKQAKAAGKPVTGLETEVELIQALAALPEPVAVQFLKATLNKAMLEGPPITVAQWLAGSETSGLASLREQQPEVFRVLVTERNTSWAKKIEALLQGDGVAFVTVGAGHLGGPDNLRELLARDGFPVERVPETVP